MMSSTAGEPTAASRTSDDVEVAVIGAGQAGLAMGYFLRRQGRRFVILERAESIGSAWRERWESLTLFTARRYSALPGLPFPGDPDGYPTRDEVIAYLERYAETFDLPIELNSEVMQLEQGVDGRFRLEVDGRTITADQVVVATGPFQTPHVPKLAEKLADDVFQTHAVGYRRPRRRAGGDGPRRRRRQHRLPDREGALGDAQGRARRSAPARSRCPSACSGATSSGG